MTLIYNSRSNPLKCFPHNSRRPSLDECLTDLSPSHMYFNKTCEEHLSILNQNTKVCKDFSNKLAVLSNLQTSQKCIFGSTISTLKSPRSKISHILWNVYLKNYSVGNKAKR